jgi:activator of Hsp90 ATPase-like protein
MSDATPPEGVVSAHSDAEGILIVRVFDAPRELVFKAWTEAERFATWFGEHGSSIPLDKVSMDARPGGAWSATMIHGPDKVDPSDPESGLVEVLTAVLKDLGDGRTEMTFTQRGGNLPADEYSRAMRGSLIFFDRMAEHFGDSLKARHDTA